MIFRIAMMAMCFPNSEPTAGLRRRIALAACLLLATSLFAGCRGEVLGQVDGRVTLAGEPVRQGYVIFGNQAKGVHIMAEIGDDGTYQVAMAKGYGLPLGEYHVYLSPPVPDVPFGPAKEPPRPSEVAKFPEKYLQADSSELKLTVESGTNRFDIDMQP